MYSQDLADELPKKHVEASLKMFPPKQKVRQYLDELTCNQANPQVVADELPKKCMEARLKIFSSDRKPQLYTQKIFELF